MGAEAHGHPPDPILTSLRARVRRLADAPALFELDRFISVHEAAAVIELGDHAAHGRHGLDGDHDHTGFHLELQTAEHPVVAQIQRRITALLGVPGHLEPSMRFRHYRPGEGHPPHVDNYRIHHRDLLATAMVVLRGPDRGGQTVFPSAAVAFPTDADAAEVADTLPLGVDPLDRKLVLWLNHRPDGSPEPASHHIGAPVEAGEKITLTCFVYLHAATCAAPLHAVLASAGAS